MADWDGTVLQEEEEVGPKRIKHRVRNREWSVDEHSPGWHNKLESLPLLFPLCFIFPCPGSPRLYSGCGSLTEVAKGVSFYFFSFLYREWVLKSSLLIAMAVYTYLRLIVDHHGTSQLQVLRQKEVDFCISLLRERVSKSGDAGMAGTCLAGVSVSVRGGVAPVPRAVGSVRRSGSSESPPSLHHVGFILSTSCEWLFKPIYTSYAVRLQAVERGRGAVSMRLPRFQA